MSKMCPVLGRKVVYLDCNECEDKSECGRMSKEREDVEKSCTEIKEERETPG